MAWKIFLIIILIIVVGLLIYPHLKKEKKDPQVCFKNYCFLVELVLASEEKSRGLMYRESLDKDRGMLFIYDKEGKYSFWMKNVLIPLDIIWLDKNKKVVHVAENCQPCPDLPCPSISPDNSAKYILEINAGLASEINLSLGDELKFEIN